MRPGLAVFVFAAAILPASAARCPEPYEFSRCGPGEQSPETSYLECECTSPTVGEILEEAKASPAPTFPKPSPELESALGGRFVLVRLKKVESEIPLDRAPRLRGGDGGAVVFLPYADPDRDLEAVVRIRAVVDRSGRVVEAEVVDAPEGGFGPFAKRMVLHRRFRAGRNASRAVPATVKMEIEYSPLFPR